MVTYADTSAIAALYLLQSTSHRAIEVVDSLTEPLPLTPFLVLELRNALNLAVRRDEISMSQRDEIWNCFEGDINRGGFFNVALSPEEIYRVARELSDRHSAAMGTRTLDLLHLAAAKILKVKNLLTFDERQAQAGKKEGFRLLR